MSSFSGLVGIPLHVTTYDSAGSIVAPATIVWSGLPAGVVVTIDATGCNFTATAVVSFNAIATVGDAEGQVTLAFALPPLSFKSP